MELLIQSLQQAVAKGRRVEIRDFGVFERYIQKPRVSRNPKNGQRVEVDARPSVHFKPGKELKERVNKRLLFNKVENSN